MMCNFDFDDEQRKIAESTAIIASVVTYHSPAQLCMIRESADLHHLSLELYFVLMARGFFKLNFFRQFREKIVSNILPWPKIQQITMEIVNPLLGALK